MRLWNINRTYRSTRRLAGILSVLIRYGFGEILHRMNLARPAFRIRRFFGASGRATEPGTSLGERLRMAFEELGPTFIKLGQILTTRPDIIPAEIIAQLQQLQRKVPPVPFKEISAVVAEELDLPPEALFASFDPEPIGSASIAQVHQAVLPTGEKVAVKIVKPGAAARVRADLDILGTLVGLLEKNVEEARHFHPGKVLEQFRRSINRELDLTFEAYTMTRFAEDHRDDGQVIIPRVHWGFTTSRVLTMDLVEGTPLTELESLRSRGVDLTAFADLGSKTLLKQIFVNGLFHGDPHPGNVYYMEGGRLGLVDYGMTGRISKVMRAQLTQLLSALSRRDAREMALVLMDLNVGEVETDLVSLRERLADFILSYYGVPLKHLNIRRVIGDGFEILREHGIEIPPYLTLQVKVLAQVESLGRSLDPEFSVVEAITPFAQEMMKKRLEPAQVARENFDLVREVWSAISRAPEDLSQILRKLRTGRIKVDIGHVGMKEFMKEQDRISNRVSFSIITGSVVVGSSLLFSAGVGPSFMGMPAIGLFGYVIAAGLGLWLAVAILRSGKL